MHTIAFATYAQTPGLTPDDSLAAAELQRLGIKVEPVPWDVDREWSGFDAVIVRSCWNYYLKPQEFATWIRTLGARGVPIWNPADLLLWNMDKAYLCELAGMGVSTVPTYLAGSGESLADILGEHGWSEGVVKPRISATAHSTWRVDRESARAHQPAFEAMCARGGALVQPFVPEIQTHGEWSLVFLAGEYSHAVLKRPGSSDFRVQTGGIVPGARPRPEWIVEAERIVSLVPHSWLYARVDVCEIPDGLLLMELEMLEPSLFLDQHPDAPARLAGAITRLRSDVPV
jgi:glutathione synthase/RimK-type ligase-like ATP-grasp enzyme